MKISMGTLGGVAVTLDHRDCITLPQAQAGRSGAVESGDCRRYDHAERGLKTFVELLLNYKADPNLATGAGAPP